MLRPGHLQPCSHHHFSTQHLGFFFLMEYRESNNHATITNVWHHQKVSNFVSKRAKSKYILLIFATCRISEILTKPDANKIYVLYSLLTRQIGFCIQYHELWVSIITHVCTQSQSYTESAIICLEFRKFVVCNRIFSARVCPYAQCNFQTISPTYWHYNISTDNNNNN